MAINERVKQILWGKSGATCSFPGCHLGLVASANNKDPSVTLGEIAHIVAQSSGGPRNDHSPPGGHVDGHDNLILLCHAHHEIVDRQPQTYTVEKLAQMKVDHEIWVEQQLTPRQRLKNCAPIIAGSRLPRHLILRCDRNLTSGNYLPAYFCDARGSS